MQKALKLCLAAAMFFYGNPSAHGGAVQIVPTTPKVVTTTPTPTSTPSPTSASVPTPATEGIGAVSGQIPSMSGGNGINKDAGQAKGDQAMGAAQNLLTAGLMTATAMPLISSQNPGTQTTGYIMLAMAALSAAQAAMLAMNSGDSGKTEAASAGTGADWSNGLRDSGSYVAPDSTNTQTPTEQSIAALASKSPAGAKAVSALQAGGYSLSKDGLKDPSGKTTPLSSLSSPSAMSSAGLSSETIEAVQEVLGKAEANGAKVVAMGLDSGGGGGASRSPSDSDDEWEKKMADVWKIKNPFDKSAEDKRKMIAGKSVSLGGEPIGVASENIFHKISKNYKNRVQLKEFLE